MLNDVCDEPVETYLDTSKAQQGIYILKSTNLIHNLNIIFMNVNTKSKTLVKVTTGDNILSVPLHDLSTKHITGKKLVPHHSAFANLFSSMLSNSLDYVRKTIFNNNIKHFKAVIAKATNK